METRVSEEGNFVRRRRQCGSCDKRFTTYERPDISFPTVVKKDGRRIEFDRTKLWASMHLALRKRPVSIEQVDYVRFASVYKNFEDIDEFKTLVDEFGA